MKRYFIIAGLFVFTFCSTKKTEIPGGVLKEDKMVDVLTDMHIGQAAAGMNAMSDSIAHTLSDYMPSILKLHNVTQAQFDTSMKFYTSHPELLDSVYKQIIDELSKKQGQADALN